VNPPNLFSKKGEASEAPVKGHRSKLSRLATVWPLLLIVAFVWLLWTLFGDRFQGSRAVELVSVVTQRASVETAAPVDGAPTSDSSFEAATLFQASGWIEADPLPIRVTALYSGVVEAVHVLEGERVVEGQLLATLIDDDARLDVATAGAMLGQAEASLRTQIAAEKAMAASLRTLELEIETAQSRLKELLDESARLGRAGKEVFPERDVVQARLRVDTQQRSIDALNARLDERRADLDAAAARVDHARQAVVNAQTELGRKELALERTRIRSPLDAVIQELYVTPGMKRMVGMDALDSATVAKLYQPELLQARIDVPLEEAASLFIGQAVRLRSSLFPNREFKGRVSRLEGQADIQRNTLQAKVALLDPDPQLRPEMLCRAEFLAPPGAAGPVRSAGGSRVAVFVPEAAVLDSDGSASVWILDASGERALRQSIELTEERREGFVRIRAGLRPGDRVVVNPPEDLEAGERIRAIEAN
jgi:RND family efflux transporter MFP subunit